MFIIMTYVKYDILRKAIIGTYISDLFILVTFISNV